LNIIHYSILDTIQKLDETFLENLASCRTPVLDIIFRIITHLGDYGGIWVFTAAALIIWKQTRHKAANMVLGMAVTGIVVNFILKIIINRSRPHEIIAGFSTLISPPADASFPSGHAALAFASAYGIYRILGARCGIPAYILAVIVAFSRLWVGAHFPSDVIFGAAIGVVCAVLSWKRLEKLRRKWAEEEEKRKQSIQGYDNERQ